MTFDTGTNLTALGFAFLFLKYILPILIGLALVVGGVAFFSYLYRRTYNPLTGFDERWYIAIAIILILIVISLT